MANVELTKLEFQGLHNFQMGGTAECHRVFQCQKVMAGS